MPVHKYDTVRIHSYILISAQEYEGYDSGTRILTTQEMKELDETRKRIALSKDVLLLLRQRRVSVSLCTCVLITEERELEKTSECRG